FFGPRGSNATLPDISGIVLQEPPTSVGRKRNARFASPHQSVEGDRTKNQDLLYLSIAMLAAIVVLVETLLTIAPGLKHGYLFYQQVGQAVASDYREHHTIPTHNQPIVMVTDAADYYYATGQHAVLLPTQNLATILEAAHNFSVSYILFTPNQGHEERR